MAIHLLLWSENEREREKKQKKADEYHLHTGGTFCFFSGL